MHDAIQTAQGKPGSHLWVIYIGTLAPSRGGWWHNLTNDGTDGSTFVQALQGDPEKWDTWPEIRRCNPLAAVSAAFRAKLLEERDKARQDTRLKARFLSYRLNVPSADESSVLLTVDEWQRVCGRPVPDREGRPIAAVDLGGGRAWSAGVAVWRNGRTEAVAVAPGVPDIAAQEARDRVPRGTYQRLVDAGVLRVAQGKRVQPAGELLELVKPWAPEAVFCDRFRLPELLDAAGRWPVPIVPRVTRWSEASDDIRGLRRLALDGPLACEPQSRGLVAASLAVASVKGDDQGNVRLVKRDRNNTARDDVAQALTLAAGAVARSPDRPRRVYLGRI